MQRILLAVCCGVILALLAFSPVGPAAGLLPVASAHAVLVRSDPAANAILNAPPSHVVMWFSEDVNPLTSRAVVVNTANQEVDNKDAHVSDDDSKQMIVTLPLLKAGTYVVVWRTQSADDGHITGGSFIFRIQAPDGEVPPIPSTLPSGNIPGGGGIGDASSSGLDAPSIVQAIFTWLALLGMVFWVGGVIWETWILPSGLTQDGALREAARTAEQRFRRWAPIALIVVLVADIGMILAQSAELAGDFSGIVSPPLLRAVLFGSRFGTFWWMRELVALAALALTILATRRDLPFGSLQPTERAVDTDTDTVAGWGHALLMTLRSIPQLPGRLAAGLRTRTLLGGTLLVLAAALIVAFALSGHAAAVPTNELAYALVVDLFHLVCNAAWVGGLLYISLIFVPALARLDIRTRARVLALGLPEFGAVAILSAFLLAATGTLNTTIHLTSIDQFLTTAYGRTLFVKIELFLLMVGISAWHAFRVRPELAQTLARQDALTSVGSPVVATVSADGPITADAQWVTSGNGSKGGKDGKDGKGGERLLRETAVKLEDWLRREAMLGAAVLFCAALLGAFAGTLAAPPASGGTPITPSGPFLQTQQVGNYAITLNVVPAKFGDNTFTVTVKGNKGQPVTNAIVVVTTIDIDMDMGEESTQLKAVGADQPGVYSGPGVLTMGGHWQLVVKVVPPGAPQPVTASFKLLIGYS
jgi:putative copper export protein/methionine-rich copper-binding protein CopC